MKTRKKLLPILLALGIMLQTVPTVWAEDIVQQPESAAEYIYSESADEVTQQTDENGDSDALDNADGGTAQEDNAVSENGGENAAQEGNTTPDNVDTDTAQEDSTAVDDTAANNTADDEAISDGIALFSMMPIDKENVNVYIYRPQLEDQPEFSFYVKELLYDKLFAAGKLNADGEYEGKIAYSLSENDYKLVGWNDIITLDMSFDFHSHQSRYKDIVNFIISDDQLNTSADAYQLNVYYQTYSLGLFNECTFDIYNSIDEKEEPYSSYGYIWGIDGKSYIHYYDQVVTYNWGEDEHPRMRIQLPIGFTTDDATIYEGLLFTEEEIGSALDITSLCVNDGIEMTFNQSLLMTIVTEYNGRKIFIPIEYTIYDIENSVYVDDKNVNIWLQYEYQGNSYRYNRVAKLIYAESFDESNPSIRLVYYDYLNEIPGYTVDKIEFACFGNYDSVEAAQAAGEVNIKDKLFGRYYSISTEIDKSKWYDLTAYTDYIGGKQINVKAIDITVVDKYGILYNETAYYVLSEYKQGEHSPSLSDDTYFRVYSAYYDGDEEKEYANSYKIDSDYDSYYLNGYQTLLILDNDENPITSEYIYPYFTTGENARIYIGNDVAAESGENELQISGESRLRFKSGEAIQYSAASESGKHLKNYWITFITPQSGAKLFVNATNNSAENENPKRAIFLNASNSYCHDIMFANIGDEELNGLKVTLSEETTGVKLDEYWTIIDNSVGTLAPFTNTDGNNIAKIRLVPVDDSFAPISGQLTISSANGGSTTIDLTGIAGVPQIVTDKLYDGVKYVPYSSVIMTNCMYESDAMKFEKVKGSLPAGVRLNPDTGELYGIPTRPGTYTFTIKATYTGEVPMDSDEYSCQREYTLVINDNTDDFVDAVNEDDQGYTLTDRVSKEVTVYYNGMTGNTPNIDRIELDNDIFRSEGSYSEEFCAFYIDGVKLTENLDYRAVEGSTVITINAQTFGKIGLTTSDIPHTLAAEFRTENRQKDLRRSAQNVYVTFVNIAPDDDSNNDNGGNNGNTGNNSNGNGNESMVVGPIDSNWANKIESGEVKAVMGVVDKNGNPISGLSLELHSKPKYAKTDSNGCAEFGEVEFGKHTLYVLDDEGNKVASKAFTIVSGSAAGIKGSVITAEANSVVNLSVEFDGKNLKLLAAQEDVSSMAGAFDESSIAWISRTTDTVWSKLFAIWFVLADIAVAVLLIRKKLSSD